MFFCMVNWVYLVTLGSLCAYLLLDSWTAAAVVAGAATAMLLHQRGQSRREELADWGTSAFSRWLLLRLARVDVFVNRLSRGTLLGESGRAHISRLCISCRGARSGEPRIVPLMRYRINDLTCLEFAGDVVAGTNNGGEKNPAWVHNFRACEQRGDCVVYNKGASVFKARVREMTDPAEREALLAEMVAANPGFEEKQSRTRRQVPVFILRPLGEWRWESAPDELIDRLTPPTGPLGRALIRLADAF